MKIIKNMPSAEYHAHPAISKSMLDKIARSPLHARAYMDGVIEQPTAAMQFGTALHTAILEPDRFGSEFAVFDGDKRTKAGKELFESLSKTGATIITSADFDVIHAMTMAVRNHSIASQILTDGEAEASVFWTGENGLECKCRPDYWRQTSGVVVDVKSCEDASPAAFARSAVNYRYHVQAAHYMAGTGASRFLFIAIEKKAPHAVAVYELDRSAIDLGRRLRDRDIAQFASCIEFGMWPGFPEEIVTLELPAWAIGSEE